jgi:uncharacterized membrane protein YedE/YeeE
MRYLTQLLSGLIFGLGLAIGGMTLPQNVLAFLDITGNWDPSLLFVLGGAVVTAAVAFRLILKQLHPVLDESFHISRAQKPDVCLITGSLLFGIGWGISGYCPGPAIALLATPANPETWIFLGGLFLGFGLDKYLDKP